MKSIEFFFFQAEDGIRDLTVTGVQTCALPILLQQREIIPVGATEALPVDARLVAATNRDLEDEVKRGGFRGDLYYRLNVITVHLPPLRDRRDDVPLLVDAFLRRAAATRGTEIGRAS